MKKFYNRLKEARKFKGLRQEDLAARIGVAGPTLSQYENGKGAPDLETLQKIIALTGVNPAWLLMGVGDMIGDTEFSGKDDYMELKQIVSRLMGSDDPEAARIVQLMLRWDQANPEEDGGIVGKKQAG